MKQVALLAPLPPPYGGIAVWTQRMLNAKLPSDWKIAVVDEKVIGKRTVFGKNKKRSFFSEVKRCLLIWFRLVQILRDNDTEIVHICIPAGIRSLIREIVSATLARIIRKRLLYILDALCLIWFLGGCIYLCLSCWLGLVMNFLF